MKVIIAPDSLKGNMRVKRVCEIIGQAIRQELPDAHIVSGAKRIAETAGLPELLGGTDLLITGGGRTDGQTVSGKLCAVLAEMAKEHGVKPRLLSGALAGDLDSFLKLFDYAFSISSGHGSLGNCIRRAPSILHHAHCA